MATYGLLASSSAAVVPSVILVHLLDDFGHFDTGFAGNTEARTPHLETIATRPLDRALAHSPAQQ
jgi:hypothetical protein